MSHDLQSPLNVAQTRVKLARDEREWDHIDDVAQAHNRMEALIDDLLTLARKGNSISELEEVALAEISESCWETIVSPNATLATEVNKTIEADPSRLKQLLGNLFRNAVEHAGDEVTVTVGELVDSDGFYVADDGSGIPDDERDAVFDAGYSTSNEGTGFGLTIVQGVAQAHDWDVRVADNKDGGTRFEITRPPGADD